MMLKTLRVDKLLQGPNSTYFPQVREVIVLLVIEHRK